MDSAAPVRRSWLRRHRTLLIGVAQLIALVLIVWLLVLPQLGGAMNHIHLMFDIHNPWLPAAFAAEIVSLDAYTLVTWSLLAPGTRPAVNRVGRIDLSSIAVGKCVPDGGTVGTALCWRLLVKEGVPTADAGLAKMVQGLGAAIVLQMMLLAIYLLAALNQGYSRWQSLPMFWSMGFLAVTLTAVGAGSHRGLREWMLGLIRRIPRIGARIADLLDTLGRREVVDHFRSFRTSPKGAIPVLAAIGNWSFDAFALWLAIRAFGGTVDLLGLAIVYGVSQLAVWLPITPGGLGVADSIMIPALIGFGVSGTAAGLGILTWRLLSFWLPIPLGGLSYLSLAGGPTLRRRQRQSTTTSNGS